jgi:hypothetical protein
MNTPDTGPTKRKPSGVIADSEDMRGREWLKKFERPLHLSI